MRINIVEFRKHLKAALEEEEMGAQWRTATRLAVIYASPNEGGPVSVG
jgi:hypothetical protein